MKRPKVKIYTGTSEFNGSLRYFFSRGRDGCKHLYEDFSEHKRKLQYLIDEFSITHDVVVIDPISKS